MSYTKDWDYDETDEVLNPLYNDAFKRYDISMEALIAAINKSKYPIDGSNIFIPGDDGGWLPDVVDRPDSNPALIYRAEMVSSNGNIIKDREFYTELSIVLYKDNEDITSKIEEKYFKWTRVSGPTEEHQIKDAEWNLRWATGARSIIVKADDVDRRAMFQVQFVTPAEEVLWVVNMYNKYMELNK